jgi:hypothetical protein
MPEHKQDQEGIASLITPARQSSPIYPKRLQRSRKRGARLGRWCHADILTTFVNGGVV